MLLVLAIPRIRCGHVLRAAGRDLVVDQSSAASADIVVVAVDYLRCRYTRSSRSNPRGPFEPSRGLR
jgi:hypothetical protein